MTAICAVVADGRVFMGGDSAGTSGLSLTIRTDPKVFVNGGFAMGFTSSYRMGQLLRWSFTPPPQGDIESDEQYMSVTFINAVRECLKTGGFAKKENEVEEGGVFLVGWHAQIWAVYSDYQVAQHLDDYAAIGSGFDLCLGSLHGSGILGHWPPAVRIIKALDAAEHHNAGVRRPFTVVSV